MYLFDFFLCPVDLEKQVLVCRADASRTTNASLHVHLTFRWCIVDFENQACALRTECRQTMCPTNLHRMPTWPWRTAMYITYYIFEDEYCGTVNLENVFQRPRETSTCPRGRWIRKQCRQTMCGVCSDVTVEVDEVIDGSGHRQRHDSDPHCLYHVTL